MKGSKVSLIWRNPWNDNLRHNNHAEVQPVPGVPQEGEGADAEAPRQHLYQRLKRVNASERVPERKRKRRDGQRFRARGVKAKAHGWHTESMNADGTQTWSWEEMWSTFTVQQPLWHEWQRVAPWWTAEWTLTPPPPEWSGWRCSILEHLSLPSLTRLSVFVSWSRSGLYRTSHHITFTNRLTWNRCGIYGILNLISMHKPQNSRDISSKSVQKMQKRSVDSHLRLFVGYKIHTVALKCIYTLFTCI